MNNTLNLLYNRVSLRSYQDKNINNEDLKCILNSAMRAPTAGNMMLYSIIVIKDKEKKKKLSQTCDNQSFIATAPLILIFVADMQRWSDYFDYCGIKQYCKENNLEYRSPNYSDLFLSISDAMIAAQNAVISAESLNIGSCYIGDIMENYEIHKDILDLPDKTFPIGMLTLGYYPENMKRTIKPRFDKEFIIFDEKYKRLSSKDFETMFQNLNNNLNKNNSYNAKNIGQLVYARKFGSPFSKEMERSINIMLKHWKS